MLGAIAGDIIGSLYEANPIRTTDFPLFGPGCRFTDDTVLTVAIADALMGERDYTAALKGYARLYPRAGYGGAFRHWSQSESTEPYNSWGQMLTRFFTPAVALANHGESGKGTGTPLA